MRAAAEPQPRAMAIPEPDSAECCAVVVDELAGAADAPRQLGRVDQFAGGASGETLGDRVCELVELGVA